MTTQELAIDQARKCRESADPIRTLLSCCWVSLSLLYEELARVKQIPLIMNLTKEKKLYYWRQTEGSRWKRIWQAQALFMFDILNDKIDVFEGENMEMENA